MFLASDDESAKWAGIILAKLLPYTLLKKQKIALFLRANNNLYEGLTSKKIQFQFFDLLLLFFLRVLRIFKICLSILYLFNGVFAHSVYLIGNVARHVSHTLICVEEDEDTQKHNHHACEDQISTTSGYVV